MLVYVQQHVMTSLQGILWTQPHGPWLCLLFSTATFAGCLRVPERAENAGVVWHQGIPFYPPQRVTLVVVCWLLCSLWCGMCRSMGEVAESDDMLERCLYGIPPAACFQDTQCFACWAGNESLPVAEKFRHAHLFAIRACTMFRAVQFVNWSPELCHVTYMLHTCSCTYIGHNYIALLLLPAGIRLLPLRCALGCILNCAVAVCLLCTLGLHNFVHVPWLSNSHEFVLPISSGLRSGSVAEQCCWAMCPETACGRQHAWPVVIFLEFSPCAVVQHQGGTTCEALYVSAALERAWHPYFNIFTANTRMSYAEPLNRPLFLALFKQMQARC